VWACLLQNVADPVIGSLDTLLTLQLGRARDSLRWLELLRVVQLSLKRPVALPGEVQMGNIGLVQIGAAWLPAADILTLCSKLPRHT
jgi:hypothetical protein